MKSIILTSLLLLLAGCGGTPPSQIAIPQNADIRASLSFDIVSGAPQAEVVFMYTTPVAPGSKELGAPTTIAVDDPRLDGDALTAKTDSGSPVYTSTTAAPRPSNTISGRVNGVLYEGKTVPGAQRNSKVQVVTLVAK